jgi:hypothetical protein
MKQRWAKAHIDDIPASTPPTDEEFYTQWKAKMQVSLADECSDLMQYFDLFLSGNDIDIKTEIKRKFNRVSEEMGCPEWKIL